MVGIKLKERLTKKTEDGRYIVQDELVKRDAILDCNMPTEFCIKMIDKLGEFEDLEEQSLLVKLPVAVGDTVYFIKSAFAYMNKPKEEKVRKIDLISGGMIFRTDNRSFEIEKIGKTVFLTKEQAEMVLKEMKE